MSHITDAKLRVRDLDALEVAAAECGLELRRDQKTFKWFGRFMGDSAVPKGRDPRDYGKCEHALRMKDATERDYEIGVCRALDGDGYDLLMDTWGQARLLERVGGANVNKLRREYAAAGLLNKARVALARKGFVATRENVGNRIQLRLRRR